MEARDKPNYDVVLFIGLAQSREYFTLESQAHRDGYGEKDKDGNEKKDVDGKSMEGDQFWKPREREKGDEGFEAPAILKTGFNCDKVWGRWKNAVEVR